MFCWRGRKGPSPPIKHKSEDVLETVGLGHGQKDLKGNPGLKPKKKFGKSNKRKSVSVCELRESLINPDERNGSEVEGHGGLGTLSSKTPDILLLYSKGDEEDSWDFKSLWGKDISEWGQRTGAGTTSGKPNSKAKGSHQPTNNKNNNNKSRRNLALVKFGEDTELSSKPLLSDNDDRFTSGLLELIPNLLNTKRKIGSVEVQDSRPDTKCDLERDPELIHLDIRPEPAPDPGDDSELSQVECSSELELLDNESRVDLIPLEIDVTFHDSPQQGHRSYPNSTGSSTGTRTTTCLVSSPGGYSISSDLSRAHSGTPQEINLSDLEGETVDPEIPLVIEKSSVFELPTLRDDHASLKPPRVVEKRVCHDKQLPQSKPNESERRDVTQNGNSFLQKTSNQRAPAEIVLEVPESIQSTTSNETQVTYRVPTEKITKRNRKKEPRKVQKPDSNQSLVEMRTETKKVESESSTPILSQEDINKLIHEATERAVGTERMKRLAELENAKGRLAVSECELAEARKQYVDLIIRNDEETLARANLEKMLELAKSRILELEREQDDANKAHLKKFEEMRELKSNEIRDLQERFDAKNKELELLTQKKQLSQRNLRVKRQNSSDQVESINRNMMAEEIRSLQIVVEMRNGDIRKLRNQLDSLKEEQSKEERVYEENKNLKLQVEDLGAQLEKTRNERDNFVSRFHGLEEQYHTLLTENARLVCTNEELSYQLDSFKTEARQVNSISNLPRPRVNPLLRNNTK